MTREIDFKILNYGVTALVLPDYISRSDVNTPECQVSMSTGCSIYRGDEADPKCCLFSIYLYFFWMVVSAAGAGDNRHILPHCLGLTHILKHPWSLLEDEQTPGWSIHRRVTSVLKYNISSLKLPQSFIDVYLTFPYRRNRIVPLLNFVFEY